MKYLVRQIYLMFISAVIALACGQQAYAYSLTQLERDSLTSAFVSAGMSDTEVASGLARVTTHVANTGSISSSDIAKIISLITGIGTGLSGYSSSTSRVTDLLDAWTEGVSASQLSTAISGLSGSDLNSYLEQLGINARSGWSNVDVSSDGTTGTYCIGGFSGGQICIELGGSGSSWTGNSSGSSDRTCMTTENGGTFCVEQPDSITKYDYKDPSDVNGGKLSSISKEAKRSDPYSSLMTDVASELRDSTIPDKITDFTGTSTTYRSYNSSLLFDKDDAEFNKSRYPQLYQPSTSGASTGSDTPPVSMSTLNLGVDDEVRKLQMPVFTPLRTLKQDFANNEQSKDDYLDLFQSVRGVAILTLSYLDKTVSAGLATTQQQADANTSNYILKQISWATKEVAEPQRDQLYNDVNEKTELCLLSSTGSSTSSKALARLPKNFEGECTAVCGPKPSGSSGSGSGGSTSGGSSGNSNTPAISFGKAATTNVSTASTTKASTSGSTTANGIYEWCTCCAGQSYTVNTGVTNKNADGYWSVWDRVFFGTEGSTSASGTSGQNSSLGLEMVDVARNAAKRIYGDIVFTANSDTKSSSSSTMPKFKFIYPKLSVPQNINVLRNGCTGKMVEKEECTNMSSLVSGDSSKFVGICPGLITVLKNWATLSKKGKSSFLGAWQNASLGIMLTGKDINDMFDLSKVTPEELQTMASTSGSSDPLWLPDGDLKYIVNTFCDLSSVAAFRKVLVRMRATVNDHIAINQAATEQDKARVYALMSRVDRTLDLAEQERLSETQVESLKTNVDRNSSRGKVANIATLVESYRQRLSNSHDTSVVWGMPAGGGGYVSGN